MLRWAARERGEGVALAAWQRGERGNTGVLDTTGEMAASTASFLHLLLLALQLGQLILQLGQLTLQHVSDLEEMHRVKIAENSQVR